ncbi:putative chromosome segregation protein SudA [Umbelopsis sp. PMI_123]|nr:putative chromosome segregation protein SudA [Umbelopsis sp. PMI_123]
MHIKEITIQGFKSYKEQISFDPFSPRHNVVVGRNGSGKSNFFAAIRFVLSDAYQSMGREDRQSLLHEGTGPATISAYVEIIFDNSDNRFPTGKPELQLRRSIGLQKDEYSLDGKSATKTDVMNLLEAAGFSRSNPYYIVPQGKVTTLTNAKDADRLQLLKEVAGTKIYEQRRSESTRLIAESDAKRSKIDELLKYIQEKLGELEEEKDELDQYQTLDKERRSLEYTIYARELADANRKLEELEENRARDVETSAIKRQQLADNETTFSELESRLRSVEQQVDLLDLERTQVLEDREALLKSKVQLELSVGDLEESQLSEKDYKAKISAEQQSIDTEIAAKENELASILPQYDEIMAQATSLQKELANAQQKQQGLFDKQARLSRFASKVERDSWLNSEITELNNTIESLRQQGMQTEQAKSAIQQRLERLDSELVKAKEESDARQAEIDALEEEHSELRIQRDELTENRKELWRADAKLDSILQNCRDEVRKAERILSSAVDKKTSTGLASVRRITEKLGLKGVYGPLYELFEVDDRFRTAVEITAGSSLFHVVVDNDETATRLLEAMAAEKAGRVTFMPLNRLRTRPTVYPNGADAIPMMSKLKFDPMFQRALEQIFSRTIVCQNLAVAAAYSKSHGFNAITLEGDRIDNRGALSGGYHDTRHSRLEAAKNMKKWETKLQEEKDRGVRIKEDITRLDQEITKVLSKAQLADTRRRLAHDQKDPLAFRLQAIHKERESLTTNMAVKDNAIETLRSNIEQTQFQLQAYQQELVTDVSQELPENEQIVLRQLTSETEQLKNSLNMISATRSEIEARKRTLEDELDVNLKRRRDDLALKQTLIRNIVDGKQLATVQKKLKRAEKKIAKATSRLSEIERELEQFQAQSQQHTTDLEELRNEQNEINRNLHRQEKSVEKYLLKRSLLLQKKNECTSNIRDLGVLPEEAFERYTKMSMEKLLKRLHKTNENLKKYSHVNKKAFEQYSNFTKQRGQLMNRKKELDKSSKSIVDLIKVLDQRKDHAIVRTFDQVSKNFAEVFEKLVPAGRGQLVMIRKAQEDTNDMDTDNDHSSTGNYSGISIKVSFNSKTDEGLVMQQLSGGQKSLVALALIFAIQKCDPAPFYLFDEIDANLDAQYRTAVAAMIEEMSEHGQFISTTFRPELLANADKFYGVTFNNKVSHIDSISKEDAMGFVEQEQAQ